MGRGLKVPLMLGFPKEHQPSPWCNKHCNPTEPRCAALGAIWILPEVPCYQCWVVAWLGFYHRLYHRLYHSLPWIYHEFTIFFDLWSIFANSSHSMSASALACSPWIGFFHPATGRASALPRKPHQGWLWRIMLLSKHHFNMGLSENRVYSQL